MKRFIPAVRPIFTVDGRERPDAHGSCVLLRVGDRHFALSAAHVFDSMEENELYIAGETHLLSLPRNWYGTPMPASGKREDDKIDVAFLEVPDSVVAEMGNCLWLAPENLVRPGGTHATRLYCTIGYPVRRSRVRSAALSVAAPADSYAGVSVDDPAVFAHLGLSPNTHILISFDREKIISPHGVRVPTVKPYGKSGGGLWRFDSLVAPGIPALANPLVGILTEWRRDEKLMVATRIELYVAALNQRYPGLL